jgi:hypothetical protein
LDSDVIVWLIIIAVWLISNVVAFLRRMVKKSQQMAEQHAKKRPEHRPGVGQQRPAAPPAPAPRRQPPPPPPQPQPAVSKQAEDALTQLLRSFGVEVPQSVPEQPVASEHVPSRGEHAQAAAQTRGTPSEHDHTRGWHERAAKWTTKTASEHSLAPSFHRGTAGEHLAGDVFLPDRAVAAAAPRRPLDPGIGRRLVAALHGDREGLARAILLREVLGPPIGMRPPGQRSFER